MILRHQWCVLLIVPFCLGSVIDNTISSNLKESKQSIRENIPNESKNDQSLHQDNLDNSEAENSLPTGHLKKLGEHGEPLLKDIMELDYMISGKDFYQHFARKRRPVIFRGVTNKWASTRYWKNESYLIEKYADVVFDVETSKVYDSALNTRRTMKMQEFLSEFRTQTLYLDSPFPQTPMMADLELPLMLQCDEQYKSFQSMHLLFSNGNTSSPLHHDGYENFLSVFSGIKVVYVIEPQYGKELYVESVEDFPGLSPINPERVDFEKFPLFKDVPFHKVTIRPGDMLYIPQYWFHQVRSFDSPNIAASMWFHIFSISNMDNLAYRDVLNLTERFRKEVEMAPETIDCEHQNRKMSDFSSEMDLRKFTENEKNVPADVVNKVTLYDEVRPGQPILYAGSDDTYIYAVDMVGGGVKWKIKTKEDTGSTCAFNADGSLVYCGADDGRMRALFARNGTLLWEFRASDAIISSVVVDSVGNLYFGCLDFYMYSITSNGKRRWKRYLGNQIWSTPLLHPEFDVLFIATKGDPNDNKMNAFALATSSGKFLWRAYIPGGMIATPRLRHSSAVDPPQSNDTTRPTTTNLDEESAGKETENVESKTRRKKSSKTRESKEKTKKDIVFFCSLTGNIVGLDIEDGKPVWEKHVEDSGELWSTPALGPAHVMYVLFGSGRLLALNTSSPANSSSGIVWEKELNEIAGHLTDAARKEDRGSNSSPLLTSDGILYVGTSTGVLFAIRAESGDILWQKRIGTGIFFSSPRVSNHGILFVGSVDGPLFALDTKDNGNILWSMYTEKPFVGTALLTREFTLEKYHSSEDRIFKKDEL